MLGLVALLGMAGIGYFIAREIVFRRPTEHAAPTIAGSPPPSASEPAPVASVPPLPSVSVSATPSAPKPKPKVVKAPVSATAAPTPDDCDPPYTFDSNGMKKYKPHCL
jgi:hypothetical protein